MALEFIGTCHDMEILESLCHNFEKCGIAKKVKDSSFYEKQEDGFDTGAVQNKFSTKVYNNYLLTIKDRKSIVPFVVKIRFWRDERLNKAGVKITEDGLMVILQSITVVNLLHKMNENLGNNGDIELSKVAELLTKALNNNNAIPPITVAKVD